MTLIQLKIINEPSNEKNFNIRIIQPTELPSINIEKLQNEFINKYIADNIKKLYREKLILSGSSKVSPNFTITKEYTDLKSQLSKDAVEKFNKDKSKLIEKEKQNLIENYELTLKRNKIEQIKKLTEQKEKETDSNLKQEIEEKINMLQKEKDEPSIKFKEKNNLLTPVVDLKKGTTIKVSITLEVRIYRQIKTGKEALERVKENVKLSCKNRRNKILWLTFDLLIQACPHAHTHTHTRTLSP